MLPWWLSGKESTCNAGDTGSVPGSGRYPGGRHGNPLQYSCLGNAINRGAWWAAVHGVTKHQTQLMLSMLSEWNSCESQKVRCNSRGRKTEA